MSNFSNIYRLYLTGYTLEGSMLSEQLTERLMQTVALGVHHRVTSKPPLMNSSTVTTELRTLSPKQHTTPVMFTRLLLTNADSNQKIAAIKAVREISHMGLLEAKRICDEVCAGMPRNLASVVGSWWRPDLTSSERIAAAAKLLRDAGCTVEVS